MPKKRRTKITSKKSASKTSPSKTNKRQTSLAQKTEQILLTMPRIIASQIAKDLNVLKQQEIKISGDLKKADAKKKKSTLQLTSLKKKKTTAAKKRFKTTEKTVQKTNKLITTLTRAVEDARKQSQALSAKKDKYTALQTQLTQFEKEWTKKLSQKKTTKSKTRTKSRSSAQKSTRSKNTETENTHYTPQEPIILEFSEGSTPDNDKSTQKPVETIF